MRRGEWCLTSKRLWGLLPRTVIFSDYAVVAGPRLGVSQGRMPQVLLGRLPVRRSQSQIREKLQYHDEPYANSFQPHQPI